MLAELCRGALSTRPLPQQPLDAQDEEDFPKVKRLIRTLRLLEAIIIIPPFLAAHCLGTMTILDTRRRSRRYAELGDYLRRLAGTLRRTQANPNRLRLIEHAERTLIEEQHEWFSVMRNLSV